jgi:hypothetical protein
MESLERTTLFTVVRNALATPRMRARGQQMRWKDAHKYVGVEIFERDGRPGVERERAVKREKSESGQAGPHIRLFAALQGPSLL